MVVGYQRMFYSETRTLEFYNVINDALLARSKPVVVAAARAKVYTCTDTSIDVCDRWATVHCSVNTGISAGGSRMTISSQKGRRKDCGYVVAFLCGAWKHAVKFIKEICVNPFRCR